MLLPLCCAGYCHFDGPDCHLGLSPEHQGEHQDKNLPNPAAKEGYQGVSLTTSSSLFIHAQNKGFLQNLLFVLQGGKKSCETKLCVCFPEKPLKLERRFTLQCTKAVSMHGDASIFSCTGHGICLYRHCNVSGTWVSKSIYNLS